MGLNNEVDLFFGNKEIEENIRAFWSRSILLYRSFKGEEDKMVWTLNKSHGFYVKDYYKALRIGANKLSLAKYMGS